MAAMGEEDTDFCPRGEDSSAQCTCHRNQPNTSIFKKKLCKHSYLYKGIAASLNTLIHEFVLWLTDDDIAEGPLPSKVLEMHSCTYDKTPSWSDRMSMSRYFSKTFAEVCKDPESEFSKLGESRVERFCEGVPGFTNLCKQDQEILLKSASQEIMVLRFCARYIPELDGYYYPSGNGISRRETLENLSSWATVIMDISEKLVTLDIDDMELALLQSILLYSERPGLKNPQQVKDLENQFRTALMTHACKRRVTFPQALFELVKKIFGIVQITQFCFTTFATEAQAPDASDQANND